MSDDIIAVLSFIWYTAIDFATEHRDFVWTIWMIAGMLWLWRIVERRWYLSIIWGWRGQFHRGLRAWIAYRLTGVVPLDDKIDFKAHVETHKRTTLFWTIMGSSR